MDKKYLKKMLCTKCKEVCIVNLQNKYYFSYFAIIVIGTMLYYLILDDSFSLESHFLLLVIFITIILFAFYFAFDIVRKRRNCSVCDGKNTLIDIESPEAMEFIKENNISIPKDSQDDDKLPWETTS